MRVVKRNGQTEPVQFDKITQRLQQQVNREPVLKNVDPVKVAMATISSIHDMVTTEELDRESARISGSLQSVHPDYSSLASRVMISNLHKSTPDTFSKCMNAVQDHMNKEFEVNYIHPKYMKFINSNAEALDSMINIARDYEIDHYGYKNYEKTYLIKLKKYYIRKFDSDGHEIDAPVFPICDRPCYLTMRVAIALYAGVFGPTIENPLDEIRIAYKDMSDMLYTHATPTLLNSLTVNQQLASCFILGTGDSREEIMKTIVDTSAISKSAGGIGIAQHCIRPNGSLIRGTNGVTSGLPKQLVLYNANARCWDQGGDKRPGAFAQYLEPWHGDIMAVLKLKLPGGTSENRTRDLFYALWVPDLFIKRAREGAQWSLFGANIAHGLQNVYDGQLVCKYTHTEPSGKYTDIIHKVYGVPDEKQLSLAPVDEDGKIIHEYEPRNVFTDLYEMYEREGKAHKVIPIKEVLDAIFDAQRETGIPYICFKDHINRQSNQLNIGTIEASNLCTEIYEWFSSRSYATCTLASVNCTKHVTWDVEAQKYVLNSDKVVNTVMQVAKNLDNVINVNKFPVIECEQNAYDYRPIGIGTSGVSDALNLMEIPFDSTEGTIVDQEYFESMYYGAIKQSVLDAKKYGAYTAFKGSPASQGRLRFHLWIENQTRISSSLVRGFENNIYDAEVKCPNGVWIKMFSGKHDWVSLIEDVKKYGLRHSLHIALMPTATSAALIGNNDSFEPHPALIYVKESKIGKHEVCNANAIRHLHRLGLWTDSIRLRVINDQGSIQSIEEIPQHIRDIYKTVWEIKQVNLQHRSALRYAWVDQGQSMNIHAAKNTNAVLRGLLFRGHELGLGTGSYYIRTQPKVEAQQNNIAANAAIIEARVTAPTSDCCSS